MVATPSSSPAGSGGAPRGEDLRRRHTECQSAWKRDPGLECAPAGGQFGRFELTLLAGLPEDGSHDEASVAQRGVQAAGRRGVHCRGDLHALAQRHDISRQLIRIWVGKCEAGALDGDVQAADLLQEYEAKIAALERMVGRHALEIELLKGASKHAPRPRSTSTSVVTGPVVSPSAEGAR